LFSQKKETKEKAIPLPLFLFDLTSHLRADYGTQIFNPQTPRQLASAAQAKGAAQGFKSKPSEHENLTLKSPQFFEV
jgi:hypothetical protein